MTDTGALVHVPGVDGHLRLVGHNLGKHPAVIVGQLEADCGVVFLSPTTTRLFAQVELYFTPPPIAHRRPPRS